MPAVGWYYRLSSFFREKFGERVFKIPLHAGMTCPNRDGTISRAGCSFCYNPGFSPNADTPDDIATQIPNFTPNINSNINSKITSNTTSVAHTIREQTGDDVRHQHSAADTAIPNYSVMPVADPGLSVSRQILQYQLRLEQKNANRRPGKLPAQSLRSQSPYCGNQSGEEPTINHYSNQSREKSNNHYGNQSREETFIKQYCTQTREEQSSNPYSCPDRAFRPARKYLAYFQSYTNTYGSHELLQALYREALSMPGVVGMSVATRPDCLSEEILSLLGSYAGQYHVWLEIGLQSAHDQTLKLINRGHDYETFAGAVERAAGRGLYVSAHIINGLPGESRDEMLETIAKINSLPLQGIKFHHLQVVKHTPLARDWMEGRATGIVTGSATASATGRTTGIETGRATGRTASRATSRTTTESRHPETTCNGGHLSQSKTYPIKLFSAEEYLQLLCDQLELLRPDIVVHRLMGEVYREELLLAPHWQVFRGTFAQMAEAELRRRGTSQGMKS